MKLTIADVDDAGGLIFDNEEGQPIINIQLSSKLTEAQKDKLIKYIQNYEDNS